MKKILLICSLFIISSAALAQKTTIGTNPEEKAKGLQKQLKLTDEQTSKVASVYKESAQKFEKIKIAGHGNTDKMMKDIGPLRTATIKKIKTILTPGQAVKYNKLIKNNQGGSGNGWGDGWSAAAAN